MARIILEGAGYRFRGAANGGEALDSIDDETNFLLTDISMPEMDGRELIRNLNENKPSLKICAMSGLANEDELRKTGLRFEKFLKKPFDGIRLLAVIESEL